jgi:L-rhamnose mutarotase
MQRIGRRARLKPGAEADYEKWHRAIWPELRSLIRQAGLHNYTIYRDGRDLFAYLETDNWAAASEFLAGQPLARRWQELMAPLMDAADPVSPWIVLDEVFRLD